MHPLEFCILFTNYSQLRSELNFVFGSDFCFVFQLYSGAEQNGAITVKAIPPFSGFEGSPVKSHSRFASLGTLSPKAPCFVDFPSQKQFTIVFCSLTRHPHQKSRIILIRLFLSKPQVWYIIECITRLWRDIHSYIISPLGCISSLVRVYFPAV